MIDNEWSMDNVAFGMGAGLLQHVNRDTLRFAMKASAICGPHGWYGIQKTPKSDPSKSSKRGIQHVCQTVAGLSVFGTDGPSTFPEDLLQTVYSHSGEGHPNTKFWTFDQVRKMAAV
jgi:nicotinamide phosphoribosyltransferase